MSSLFEEGYLLRILIGESDRCEGKPLYEWLVLKAREQGLSGATVLRGIMGFGARSRIRTFKIERLSEDLPIIVEIIDTRDKLESFLAHIDSRITDGLVSIEKAQVHIYRSGASLSALVENIMRKDIVSIAPATPLSRVLELMLEHHVKGLPVVEGGRPIGIVTGGDLLRRANLGLRLSVQRKLPPDDLAEQLHRLEEKHLTAQDIMTKPVVTIRADVRVSDAVRLMNEKHLKRLPVVDDRGILVGIITRTDVLAAFVSVPVSEEEIGIIGVKEARTAGDVMFRDVPTVDPEATLDEVLAKIVATPLRRVVVIDESQRVLGIIVDADLLLKIGVHERASLFRALLQRLSLASAEPVKTIERAADLMSTETFAVSEDTALAEVLRIMLEKHVKRLVVTDAENHLLGMVDRRSLLQIIGSELQS